MQRRKSEMAYSAAAKCGNKAFFVPCEAAKGLKLCTAAQLRVLLLALSSGNGLFSPEDVASELDYSVDDIKDIFDYWVERGVFENSDAPAPEKTTPAPISAKCSAELKPFEVKPTMKEVERLQKENEGIAFALKEAERILGTSFTSSDTSTLVWLINWAGIAPEVLVTVIEYCSRNGHKNIRYIQKVSLEWLDSGIDTVDKAEERMRVLDEMNSWEGAVKVAADIKGRNLISKEKELCENWRALNLSPELIHTAYERTIELTGKLSFPYMNKILLGWKQKGIETPQAAAADKKEKPESGLSYELDDDEKKLLLEDSVL